jgi:hypothetical protein
MSECYKKVYTTNTVVTHIPLVCFGEFGQPPCEYLEKCCKENGMRKRKRQKRESKNDE